MFYRTEAKLQGWRALAVFEDGNECLICLGRSTTQVRAAYAAAFMEILDEEERAQVRSVALQCWQGAPDEGKWLTKNALTIPTRKPVVVGGNSADEPRVILPFQKRHAPAAEAADPVESTELMAPTAVSL
jgi:hypothetical protein